jgi:hypothetical protein
MGTDTWYVWLYKVTEFKLGILVNVVDLGERYEYPVFRSFNNNVVNTG